MENIWSLKYDIPEYSHEKHTSESYMFGQLLAPSLKP